MTTALLATLLLLSALSLVSYLYCWADILGGRPHIISLRQITGIMDRHKLTDLLGAPEPGYYFALSPQQLGWLKRRFSLNFYREAATDLVCTLGAYRYLNGTADPALAGWFITLAGLCQGINFGYSLWLVRRYAHQIGEEMDDLRD